MTTEYIGVSTVNASDTYGLQAAINAAPTNLVTAFSGAQITDEGSGLFSVPLYAGIAPIEIWANGIRLANVQGIETLTGSAGYSGQIGAFGTNSTTNKVYVYLRGLTIKYIAFVNPYLIKIPAGVFNGAIWKPGIRVQGAGDGLTQLQALSRITLTDFNLNQPVDSIVCTAAYGGRSDLSVVRKAVFDMPGNNNTCGEYACGNSEQQAIGWRAVRSSLVLDSSFARPNNLGYVVGIYFGGAGGVGANAPALGVRYEHSPVRSKAARDSFETKTGTFAGSVTFIDSPVEGTYFNDGSSSTFTFINSPKYVANSQDGKVSGPNAPGGSWIYTYGPTAPALNETYGEININSPCVIAPRPDPNADGEGTFAYGLKASILPGILFVNSNVECSLPTEKFSLATSWQSLTVGHGSVKEFVALNSSLPPLNMKTQSATLETPQIPLAVRRGASDQSTVSTTALDVMPIMATYATLAKQRRVVQKGYGTFAANANNKTLNVFVGATTAVTIGSTTGAYNGTDFSIEITHEFDNDQVFTTARLNSSSFSTVYTKFTSLTAGQTYFAKVQMTGIASADCVLKYQDTRIGLAT